MTNPTPKAALPWLRNPEYDGGDCRPPMLVGDRFLIAVPLHEISGGGYEISVIVATETGFDDADGDSWGAWDWSDVEFYVPLDGARSAGDVMGAELVGRLREETARADEAERLLALVMAKVNTFSPSQNPGACLMRDVPGLRLWCVETGDRLAKIADLTARRDRERAALAATEAELAALTEGSK